MAEPKTKEEWAEQFLEGLTGVPSLRVTRRLKKLLMVKPRKEDNPELQKALKKRQESRRKLLLKIRRSQGE